MNTDISLNNDLGFFCRFMGFLDADEFIIMKDPSIPDLPSLLERFEDYGGLVLNWRLFGSSGLLTRPGAKTASVCTKKKFGVYV